jgi:hypothetical protein
MKWKGRKDGNVPEKQQIGERDEEKVEKRNGTRERYIALTTV